MADESEEFFEDDEGSIELLTLVDDDGEAIEFEVLDTMYYEDQEYIVLLPALGEDEVDEEPAELLILQVEYDEETEEESYSAVESDELLGKLYDLFKANNAEDFDFVE